MKNPRQVSGNGFGRPLLVAFAAGGSGPWRIERIEPVCGEPVPAAARLSVLEGAAAARPGEGAAWVLRGVTSNERYVTRREHDELAAPSGAARPAGVDARRARWYYRLVAPMREHESCAEHLVMVEAIEAGDGDQAAKVARGHVERTRNAYHRPA